MNVYVVNGIIITYEKYVEALKEIGKEPSEHIKNEPSNNIFLFRDLIGRLVSISFPVSWMKTINYIKSDVKRMLTQDEIEGDVMLAFVTEFDSVMTTVHKRG